MSPPSAPHVGRVTNGLRRVVRRIPGGAIGPALFVVLLMVSGSALATAATVSQSGTTVASLHLAPPISSSPAGRLAGSSAVHATPRAPAHLPHETPAAAAPHPASGNSSGYVESGRATFFTNTPIPNPTAGNNTCNKYGFGTSLFDCYNTTTEPSLNLTTDGYTGLAYTAFTNNSPCASMSGNASTEVGFVVSTDFGITWSNPIYLGNPVCSGDPDVNYSSAFEPSLTSLPNGTFALTYIEYNASYASYGYYSAPPTAMQCGTLAGSRVVVTYSYDDGTTWTVPTVINEEDFNKSANTCPFAGFPDVRPQITAFGDTLYLAWTNATNPPYQSYGKNYTSGVNLVVSTDGGSTWSNPVNLTVVDNKFQTSGTPTTMAYNPSLLVDPSGRLYVAYATNLSYALVCGSQYCTYLYTASVMVAASTNNGSTFTYKDAADNIGSQYTWTSTYMDPFTTLAYSSVYDETYLAYTDSVFGQFCYNEGIYGNYCGQYEVDKVFFKSSSTNGSSWSAPTSPSSYLTSPLWDSLEYNPSMAVDSTGRIDLQYASINNGVCLNITTPFTTSYCGAMEDMFVYSTNNGSSWSPPLVVSGNYSFTYGPYREMWDGFTSSTLTAGTGLLLGWTHINCPNIVYSGCYQPYTTGTRTLPADSAQVVASQLFEGAGVTVIFNETLLPHGTNWSVNIQGNLRNGPSGTNLSISGVPPTSAIGWSTPWVNTSYGAAWYATGSVTSPSAFAVNTTVFDTFTEQVLVNLLTIPSAQAYCWTYPGECNNAGMSPVPGGTWVTAGTTFTFTESTVAFYLYCFACQNLSFQAWSGTGAGSVSSTSQSITFTATGPVNETANFQVLGVCWGTFYLTYGYPPCLNYTYALDFQEQGLPAGTNWGATITGPNGTAITNESVVSLDSFAAPVGVVSYQLWTVPAGSGQFWVPTSAVTSPVSVPILGVVPVTYTLQTLSTASFATTFEESGLPNGTSWSLELGSSSYGLEGSNSSVSLAGGGSYEVNGSAVYLENGTGYYVSSVSVTPYVMNETMYSIAPSGSFVANGSGLVVVVYSPMFRVSVAASTGGTVSPSAAWVQSAHTLAITESPLSGYYFVGWSGTGVGSYSGGTTNPTVTARTAITEFATFRPNAPPTWNVSLQGVGLPPGTAFTISIGGTTYSGIGSFKVGNLTQGTYAISVPTVFLNSTETTQFVPTTVASALLAGPSSLDIDQNGTVAITYTPQYAVNIATTPGGSVTWGTTSVTGLASFWFNDSSQVTFQATPAAHYYFVSWNGSGSSSVTTTTATLSLQVLGPATETAQFQWRPNTPPATFSLAVAETGLPTGTTWSVALGTLGATGSAGTLTVFGLNGTYALTAPAIYSSPGVRWISNAVNMSTTVTANGSASVMYSEQFEVTILGAVGGTVTPVGVEWVAPGTTVDLGAVANSTSLFLSWNGTGSGNYTGATASTTVTVTGPITEQVVFGPQPVSQKSSTTSASSGQLMALGLLALLLVVGLVVGLLMGRRRSPPPMSEAEPATMSDAPMDGSDGSMAAPAPEYDEGPGTN